MRLEWLGQRFSVPVFAQELTYRQPQYLVQAYQYVYPAVVRPGFWQHMPKYDKTFPDTGYVGAYFDSLCARGRSLALPVTYQTSPFSSTTRSTPVMVKMFRLEGGRWVVQSECRK